MNNSVEEVTTTYDLEDDGSDLFISEEAENDSEKAEEQPTNDEPSVEEPPKEGAEDTPVKGAEAAPPQTIRVKVKGREIDVPVDEALNPEAVRKGMAFDEVYAELEQLRVLRDQNDSSLKELGKWAKQAGMTLPDYVEHLQSVRHTQSVNAEIASIRAKYPEIPDEAAREMAETRIKEQDAEDQRAAQERQRAEQAAADQAAQEPWDDFIRRYPTMDAFEKIPPEVIADINSGSRPVEAMQRYEMKELTKKVNELNIKIEQLEQNKKNQTTALPSGVGTRDTEPKDPFLEGMGF